MYNMGHDNRLKQCLSTIKTYMVMTELHGIVGKHFTTKNHIEENFGCTNGPQCIKMTIISPNHVTHVSALERWLHNVWLS